MRSRLDEQLSLLKQKMIKMGALCENIIELTAFGLLNGNSDINQKVVPIKMDIDQKEKEIETNCLRLLLQQQPVASDLRQISAALKMITDMKRVGDIAEEISILIQKLDGRTGEECKDIEKMAKAIMKMVTESVDAYVHQDLQLAEAVTKYDDVVDDGFVCVKNGLIKMIQEDPDNGEYVIDLLLIAKYFEKIADHAVNISKWVKFSVTGKHIDE